MVNAIRLQINANAKQFKIGWHKYPLKNVSWILTWAVYFLIL